MRSRGRGSQERDRRIAASRDAPKHAVGAPAGSASLPPERDSLARGRKLDGICAPEDAALRSGIVPAPNARNRRSRDAPKHAVGAPAGSASLPPERDSLARGRKLDGIAL